MCLVLVEIFILMLTENLRSILKTRIQRREKEHFVCGYFPQNKNIYRYLHLLWLHK